MILLGGAGEPVDGMLQIVDVVNKVRPGTDCIVVVEVVYLQESILYLPRSDVDRLVGFLGRIVR